jgi:soluble lytic murein transglycosylase-like protein
MRAMRTRILVPLAAVMMLAAPDVASAAFAHVVGPGESLSSVAAADGLSVDQLAAANGMSSGGQLIAGSTLMIPPQTGGAVGSASATAATATASAGDGDGDSDDGVAASGTALSTSSAPAGAGAYVVVPGDTLSAIAARAGVSVASLAAANGIDPSAPLLAGSTLQRTGSPGAASPSASAATQPVGAAAQGSVSGAPYPTPETVTASQIGSIASANGVSPSLAAAIGWQESGFNNDLVSSADARGVMQILPGTWDWIQRTLSAGAPLAPASAADNVRGGVLLLHSLLNSTGGDPTLAAAGYYQGLSSVRSNGLFSDTQQYVNSVMALRQRFGGP